MVEAHLVDRLVTLQGWRERKPEDYDRKSALDSDMLVEFLRATQPEEWARLEAQYPGRARDELLRNLVNRLQAVGTLEVLRKGITIIPGIPFRLCAFQPASGLNAELMRAYGANILSVTRQVRYSLKNENAIDVVLFVNGIPVATLELKNTLTGSSYRTAEKQYRTDRSPAGEPLLTFKRGRAGPVRARSGPRLDDDAARERPHALPAVQPRPRRRRRQSGHRGRVPDRLPLRRSAGGARDFLARGCCSTSSAASCT